jgi:hypothetical protein
MRLITLLAIAGLTLVLVHAGPGDESVAADQFKHSYIWAADPEHSLKILLVSSREITRQLPSLFGNSPPRPEKHRTSRPASSRR